MTDVTVASAPTALRRDILTTLMPGFVGPTLPGWLDALLRDGLGGVCLFGENVVDAAQVRALTDAIVAANPDAVISIDEEGGDVTRLFYASGSPYPGNAVLGRLDDIALTRRVGAAVGEALAAVGVNLDLAPDADVNSNASNPVIGVRSFGAEPALVGRHTAAWIEGLQAEGVAACAKHFPGHGDTAQDSHRALPVVDAPLAVLRERELLPFTDAVAAGSLAIMTSHIVLPQLDDVPATFSRRILVDLLRDELGFDGLIVTDALDMAGASAETGIPEAAVRALAAGADLLCIGTDNSAVQLTAIADAVEQAVAAGRLDAARVADAAARVRGLARALPRAASGSASAATPAFDFPVDATISAFDIRDGVHVDGSRTIVALETEQNVAIGSAPWAPPLAVRVGEGEPWPFITGQLVLVGKDLHRHAWTRAAVERARREHPDAVIVDMGWPDDARTLVDVATFGASRHVGLALDAWLERSGR